MATVVGPDSHNTVGEIRRALAESGLGGASDHYRVVLLESDDHVDELAPSEPWDRTMVVVDPTCHLDQMAWDILAAGAEDVLTFYGTATSTQIVQRIRRWQVIDAILRSPPVAGLVVGRCLAQHRALLQVIELAKFGVGPILLVGETGTGKELAARLAHAVASRSAEGRLVVLDCTTITPTLSGSELFGHEKGAFTGADRSRAGAFAAADNGTLFLDEIGELPLGLQAELLRVLQEHTYKRVGGDVWARSDFRLISATNRDLVDDQRAGRFRSDLYHRIASGVVRLPPLRERTEDIETLFAHFLQEALGPDAVSVTPPVLSMLRERTFPGNLRELRQLAQAIAARHSGRGPITPGDVPPSERPARSPVRHEQARESLAQGVRHCLQVGITLPDLKSTVGDLAVDMALSDSGGNAHEAAALLGVTDRAIQLRKRRAAVA